MRKNGKALEEHTKRMKKIFINTAKTANRKYMETRKNINKMTRISVMANS